MHLRKKIVPFSASFYFCNSRFGAQRKLIVSSFRTPNQDTQLVKLIEIEQKYQTLAILRVLKEAWPVRARKRTDGTTSRYSAASLL